jgi:hypothetical protein
VTPDLLLQQNAAAALAVVCSDCPSACQRLERVGGLSMLVAAVRRASDDVNLNRGVSLLLVQLCGQSTACASMVAMGCLGLAAKQLDRFVDRSDHVTDNFLWLLTNIVNQNVDPAAGLPTAVLRHRHVTEALVRVLQKTANFHVMTHAMALLTTLAVATEPDDGGDIDDAGVPVEAAAGARLRRDVVARITDAGGKQALARAEELLGGGHRLSDNALLLCQWFKNHVQSAPICHRGTILAIYRPSSSSSSVSSSANSPSPFASPGAWDAHGGGALTALDVEVQAHYMRSLSSLGLELDSRSSFNHQLTSRSALRKIWEFLNSGNGDGGGGPDDVCVVFYSGEGDRASGDWTGFQDAGAVVSLPEIFQIWAGSAARLRGAMLFVVSDSTHSFRLAEQARRLRPHSVVLQCAQTGAAAGGDSRAAAATTTAAATAALLRRSAFLLQWLAGIAAHKLPGKIMHDMEESGVRPACYWPPNFPADRRLISVQEPPLEIPVLGGSL